MSGGGSPPAGLPGGGGALPPGRPGTEGAGLAVGAGGGPRDAGGGIALRRFPGEVWGWLYDLQYTQMNTVTPGLKRTQPAGASNKLMLFSQEDCFN